jgi:phage gp36-like protein
MVVELPDEMVKEIEDLEPHKWCSAHDLLYAQLFTDARSASSEKLKEYHVAMLNLVTSGMVSLGCDHSGELTLEPIMPN